MAYASSDAIFLTCDESKSLWIWPIKADIAKTSRPPVRASTNPGIEASRESLESDQMWSKPSGDSPS
jgi:hypothetical protein